MLSLMLEWNVAIVESVSYKISAQFIKLRSLIFQTYIIQSWKHGALFIATWRKLSLLFVNKCDIFYVGHSPQLFTANTR